MNRLKKTLFLALFSAVAGSSLLASTHSVSLDGKAWRIEGINPDRSRSISLLGSVPGMVHPDLQRQGYIPDPFWRDNFKQCQWPENWNWSYQRNFDLSPELLAKPWIQLQFDGIDTFADIFLNGRKLASVNNMFLPYEFEVKGWLKEKNNLLEVRFKTIDEVVGEQARQRQYKGAFHDKYRAYVRRMQCTFGWDWVPRFVTYGVWRSVRVVGYDDARVENLFIYTKQLTKKRAEMSLEVDLGTKKKIGGELLMEMVDPQGEIVWSQRSKVEAPKVHTEFTVDNPQIWWTNGAGEQPLYQLRAQLLDNKGVSLDSKTVETGIRTIEIEEIADHDGRGSSFTVILNGKRLYGKGANWVPADPFPARITPNQYATMLQQAQQAGINMLRVWGGGIFEPETFWNLCNRMGILASQDFMLACGGYPEDDPAFVALYKKEVEANVKMIRNHPSVMFWCGDNELGLNSKPDGEWSCKGLQQQIIAPMMSQLDPSRPFRLTSPWGVDPMTNNSLLSGDSHVNSFLSKEIKSPNFDFSTYRDLINKYSAGRFMSEQTTAGAPPRRVLERFMNEEDLAGSQMYEYHDIDNPGAGGHRTLFSHLEYVAEGLYGSWNGDVDRRIRQLEYCQYDFVRLALEGSRRRMFYSSGIQFWMYNDCWPALGWSLIDYWGGRKAAWYAFHRAAQPIIASSENRENHLVWWLSNDRQREYKAEVIVKVQPVDGGRPLYEKRLSVKVKANSSMEVLTLPLDQMKSLCGKKAMLVCEVKYEGGEDRSYWSPARPMDVEYLPTKLSVKQKRDHESGEITIFADQWAHVVTLSGDVDFEDNYFELLPGETRVIRWKARSNPHTDPITVSCWNQLPQ